MSRRRITIFVVGVLIWTVIFGGLFVQWPLNLTAALMGLGLCAVEVSLLRGPQ